MSQEDPVKNEVSKTEFIYMDRIELRSQSLAVNKAVELRL